MKRPIHKWQPEDRPREKCLNQGARQLTTTECLALIIQSGCKTHSAVDVARELLHKYESRLDRLASAEPKEWESAPGIGPAKAARIAAALELARRSEGLPAGAYPSIQSSRQAYELLRTDLSALNHEEFWAIYLSQANKVQRKMCISKGGWTQTLADSRVILQQALTHKSTAIIVAHNHPSGRLVPSEADRQLTQRLKSSCQMLDIALLDHLIIGRDDYVSFADSGWM